MANYASLKSAIQQVIRENGNEEITGALLQQSLLAMVDAMGAGYQFIGKAFPNTNPGTPDYNVFYIAGPGTYPNFGGIVISDGYMGFLAYNGNWSVSAIQISPFSAQTVVDDIVQLMDGSTPIYPRTKAAAVQFYNDANDTLFNRLLQNFVVECYLPNAISSGQYYIDNIARNVSGAWYIAIKRVGYSDNFATWYGTQEQSGIILTDTGIQIIVNWDVFPSGQQLSVHIPLLNPSNSDYQPRIWINGGYIDQRIDNIIDGKLYVLFNWDTKLAGYADTNNVSVGSTLEIIGTSTSFKHCCIPVAKGSTIYVYYLAPGSYSISHPVIVDESLTVLANINPTNCPHKTINGKDYIYFTAPANGYLFISSNSFDRPIYSDTPNLRESVNLPIASEYDNFFDYSVALAMPRALLIGMVESASNGACTVIYDNNGYPSLMYRIPLISIGALAPELGALNAPHPAFVVNGTQKKHVYAGVFMNAEYNGVPVSWWGLENIMASKSFSQCRTLCANKGAGWHLETIWERSLISLLSRKFHNTDTPRGDNYFGRSNAQGFEYECVEGVNNEIPGNFSNGAKWINGTQPVAWSHNNSRWGIFDIVGGFHEWVNLAKVDTNGKIYICADNYFDGNENNWIDTGVYITANGYDTAPGTPISSIITRNWRDIVCAPNYNDISEAIRKKLALSILCPRLLSTDMAPLFDFDGTIWLRNGVGDCYPFMGGALEYPESGLGFIILSYPSSEAHTNMGSRLFYIE